MEETVRIGSRVQTRDGELVEVWTIVARGQSDLSRGLISEDSPLARALIGHRTGERTGVRCPDGNRSIAIEAVE